MIKDSNNIIPEKTEWDLCMECVPHLKKRYDKVMIEVPFYGIRGDFLLKKDDKLEYIEAKLFAKQKVLDQCFRWSRYGIVDYVSVLWFSKVTGPLRKSCYENGFGLYFYNEKTKIFWKLFEPKKRKVDCWPPVRKQWLKQVVEDHPEVNEH